MASAHARLRKGRRSTLEIADRVHSAAIHMLRRVRSADAASGMSATRLSVLSVLVFAGPRTVGALAAAEQVRAPTMTNLVDGLARDGLAKRERDAADARRIIVRATAAGARALKAARARRVALLGEYMKRLSVDELGCLAHAAHLMQAFGRVGEIEFRRHGGTKGEG